jgi:arylsulfatase A-like enzyme
VPGIIEWPGVIRPRVTEYPVCTMDLFPTVADIVGLPEDVFVKPLDGESLRPLFAADLPSRSKPIPFRFGAKSAYIDGRYKLLTENYRQGKFQLYDLIADPRETNDLSSTQPERFEKMKQAWRGWNDSVDASFAGRDYPGGKLDPADLPSRRWTASPEYAPFITKHGDRWEYKPYVKQAGNQEKKTEGK